MVLVWLEERNLVTGVVIRESGSSGVADRCDEYPLHEVR